MVDIRQYKYCCNLYFLVRLARCTFVNVMQKAPLNISSVINASSDVVQVDITGFITDEKNCAAEIIAAIDKAKATGKKVVVRLVNCYGGNVYEGAVVYNKIKEYGLNTVAIGIVASMGTILFCAGKEREMEETATILTHKVSGAAEGSAEQIAAYAEQMKKLDKDLAGILMSVTGLTEDEVFSKLMTPGKDVYLNAKQCVDMGIATKRFGGIIKAAAPFNMLYSSNIAAIANFYDRQIHLNNPTQNKMENIAKFVAVAALKLTGDASEATVLAAVEALAKRNQELEDSNKEYKEKADAAHKAKCVALIDSAVEAKKITAAQKATYTSLAEANYDETKKALDAMKGHTPISSQLNKQQEALQADRAAWTFKDYQTKDPDALAALQTSDPDKYNALKSAAVAALRK